MNYVRTQNYSDNKGSGGLIDFTKSSLITDDRHSTDVKGRRKDSVDKEAPTFKPKELFCDRDLEYPVEQLTSATAILSAFSEEDIQHLDQLEEKRKQFWRKRLEEEKEFAKEAERIRSSLPEEEIPETKRSKSVKTQDIDSPAKTSLFFTESKSTYISQPIIVTKRKEVPTNTVDERTGCEVCKDSLQQASDKLHYTADKDTACKFVTSLVSCKQDKDKVGSKGNLPLIEGYSSSSDDNDTG